MTKSKVKAQVLELWPWVPFSNDHIKNMSWVQQSFCNTMFTNKFELAISSKGQAGPKSMMWTQRMWIYKKFN